MAIISLFLISKGASADASKMDSVTILTRSSPLLIIGALTPLDTVPIVRLIGCFLLEFMHKCKVRFTKLVIFNRFFNRLKGLVADAMLDLAGIV